MRVSIHLAIVQAGEPSFGLRFLHLCKVSSFSDLAFRSFAIRYGPAKNYGEPTCGSQSYYINIFLGASCLSWFLQQGCKVPFKPKTIYNTLHLANICKKYLIIYIHTTYACLTYMYILPPV